MSAALRRLVGILARSKSSVIFVNRLIATGSNEHKESPGGKALKHYASIRLRMERGVWPRRGSDIIGLRGDVRVVKNKLAAPLRVAEFDLLYDEGISREGELLDLGTDLGVITKSGAYYSYGDIRLGHGRDTASRFLKENRSFAQEIEAEVAGRSNIPNALGSAAFSPKFPGVFATQVLQSPPAPL